MTDRPVRVGVFGLWRGMSFAKSAEQANMQLVAVCDRRDDAREQVRAFAPDAVHYADFDDFLSHDMDAVILANYFHQHAPYAVKALDAGFHVMSETSACTTLGEAVDLVRAVERSGKVYFFAENYCFMRPVQEMKRLYDAGEIGEVRFAEAEYMHAVELRRMNDLAPGVNHWRNWIPSTYYCSHALAPVMYVTSERPVTVNARSVPFTQREKDEAMHVRQSDPGSVIVCRMGNDAVTSINGLMLRGHANWYRFHGERGLMENLRTGQRDMVRLFKERFDMQGDDLHESIYLPNFPKGHEAAISAGHGGGDYFTNYWFVHAIRTGEQPLLDVYKALDMSAVGIQAWKSVLHDGATYEVPDFRTEAARKKYAGELWSPWPEHRALQDNPPPPSVKGIREVSAAALEYARSVWREQGYDA